MQRARAVVPRVRPPGPGGGWASAACMVPHALRLRLSPCVVGTAAGLHRASTVPPTAHGVALPLLAGARAAASPARGGLAATGG